MKGLKFVFLCPTPQQVVSLAQEIPIIYSIFSLYWLKLDILRLDHSQISSILSNKKYTKLYVYLTEKCMNLILHQNLIVCLDCMYGVVAEMIGYQEKLLFKGGKKYYT